MTPTTKNFSIGITAILLLFAISLFLKKDDSCTNPSGKVVIIIDKTEWIGKDTASAIVKHSKELITNTLPNTLISIRYLKSDGLSGEKIVTCRPKRPDATTGIADNEQKVIQQYKQFLIKFEKDLEQDIPTQSASPIYSSIIDAAREEFIGIQGDKKLVIFSDFKEFTPGKTDLHTQCLDSELGRTNVISNLLIGVKDKPLNGITSYRYMILRNNMNRTSQRCLESVSDQIFNELSGSKTLELPQIIPLPISNSYRNYK